MRPSNLPLLRPGLSTITMSWFLLLSICLGLGIAGCMKTPVRPQVSKFEMIGSSLSVAPVLIPQGQVATVTFNQQTRVDGSSSMRVGVLDLWQDMGAGEWHFLGPGFASIRGIQVIPGPAAAVLIKVRPSNRVVIIPINRPPIFNLCALPNPAPPPFVRILVNCTFDSEDYDQYTGLKVFPEKWEYRPGWRRDQAPAGMPASVPMPTRAELQAALSHAPKLELLNLSPADMGISAKDLDDSVAREFKFFPMNFDLSSDLPATLPIPDVVEAPATFELKATTCGYFLDVAASDPASACAPPATNTIRVRTGPR